MQKNYLPDDIIASGMKVVRDADKTNHNPVGPSTSSAYYTSSSSESTIADIAAGEREHSRERKE